VGGTERNLPDLTCSVQNRMKAGGRRLDLGTSQTGSLRSLDSVTLQGTVCKYAGTESSNWILSISFASNGRWCMSSLGSQDTFSRAEEAGAVQGVGRRAERGRTKGVG
jgi:hypothetical protein